MNGTESGVKLSQAPGPEPHSNFARELAGNLGARHELKRESIMQIERRIDMLREEANWLEGVLHGFGEGTCAVEQPIVPEEPLDDFDIGEQPMVTPGPPVHGGGSGQRPQY